MVTKKKSACVVVLGDYGRSPRMQYHTMSLVDQLNYHVDIVAYKGDIFGKKNRGLTLQGSAPRHEILTSESVTIHSITVRRKRQITLPASPSYSQFSL